MPRGIVNLVFLKKKRKKKERKNKHKEKYQQSEKKKDTHTVHQKTATKEIIFENRYSVLLGEKKKKKAHIR